MNFNKQSIGQIYFQLLNDCLLESYISNSIAGVNGVYFMSLHAKGPIQDNPASQCVRWYRRNVNSVRWSLLNSRWLLSNICPCNQIMLVFDGRFFIFSYQNNAVCYANYRFGTSRVSTHLYLLWCAPLHLCKWRQLLAFTV